MSQPQNAARFWCFICEANIEINDLQSFDYRCLICRSDAIEMVTAENQPSQFVPPSRAQQGLLKRLGIFLSADSSSDFPTALKPLCTTEFELPFSEPEYEPVLHPDIPIIYELRPVSSQDSNKLRLRRKSSHRSC